MRSTIIVAIAFGLYYGFKYTNYSVSPTYGEKEMYNNQLSNDLEILSDHNEIIKYEKVKMNMLPYFTALEKHIETSKKEQSKLLLKRSYSSALYNAIKSTTVMGTEFDGSKKAELPIINQNMCGSCWAISCSMALKANLDLKSFGMNENEIPNLNMMIACSNNPSQIINTRNEELNWIIELSQTRHMHAGCEGGITGMCLAMLQQQKSIFIDDVREYKSGSVNLTTGPVRQSTFLNLPANSCNEVKQIAHENTLKVPFSLQDLNTVNLFRRNHVHGVFMPSTRDIRSFINKYTAVIVYVDMDSGLHKTDLFNKKGIMHLPECIWKRTDFVQSGHNDMHSISQFKEADHAMLLVGWDCNKKAWLLQNSWGTDWGDTGQIWVYDANVCSNKFEHSRHSNGAGPLCMFGSTLSAFSFSDINHMDFA